MAVYEKQTKDKLYLQEQHLYGSSRLGMIQANRQLYPNVSATYTPEKLFELTNHLGNVLAVVSDKKLPNNEPDVIAVYDYFPFGMQMPNRSKYSPSDDYRYGVGGHEKDFEIHSGWYGFGDYGYDARLGRRPTPDPIDQVSVSNYAVFANNPVMYIDPDGREVRVAQEYQEQFRNDLQNVFGDRTSMFSFSENGRLQLDGKTKDFTSGMSRDQKQAFKGLNKAMDDKTVTSVVYADNYNVTVGNEVRSVDIVQEFGGGLFSRTDNLTHIAAP